MSTQGVSGPWRGSGSRVLRLAAALWLLLDGPPRSHGAELDPQQFQVAFLAKVLPYVSWPEDAFPSPEAPLVIALFGGDPFDGLLQKVLEEAKVENRRVEVKVLTDTSPVEGCHVLFIPEAQRAAWRRLQGRFPSRGLLTVSADESGEFLRQGGLFNLKVSERKLEIQRGNVSRAELKVSSKLLRMARVL